MRGEDIRSGDMRRLEQSMKIGNDIARDTRHRDLGAPAQMIRVTSSSRTIIGANPRKLGNLRKHSAHSRLKRGAPVVGTIPVPGLENHSRAARSAALEEHLAPITDVNQFARVLVSRSISDYRLERIHKTNKEQKDASSA
jgi:hypothetical protein